MLDARPRHTLALLILILTCSTLASGQDEGAKIQAEMKKVEARIKEEQDRANKKKEAVAVEFKNAGNADTKGSLAKKLEETGTKYRTQVQEAAKMAAAAGGKPGAKPQVYTTVQTEVREAIATTIGRNLSLVLEVPMSAALLDALRSDAPVNYGAVVGETLGEVFETKNFDEAYKKMAPTFEKKLTEVQDEMAALKRRMDDLAATAKARALGAPPGMVFVPGGKVRIGMDTDEQTALRKLLSYSGDQGLNFQAGIGWPAREVQIDDFYIGINEVTNRAYLEFVKDTGHAAPKHWVPVDGAGAPKGGAPASVGTAPAGPGPGPTEQQAAAAPTAASGERVPAPGTEDYPVTWVTYEDMVAFCEWCGVRPPTEFEWEAAARAKGANDKANHIFPWGDDYDRGKPVCNNQSAAAHPNRQGKNKLLPVGSFPGGKSALGINDMAGNALEMTSSQFEAYPGYSPDKCPTKGAAQPEFSSGLLTLRGGGALHPDLCVTSAWRTARVKDSAELVGFRVAASKAKGRDYLERIAGGNLIAARMKDSGPPLKDEKDMPRIAMDDASKLGGVMTGGWDAEKQLPARAKNIALAIRDTKEFVDAARMKTLARDQKSPILLGFLATEVDLMNGAVPKGSYCVMWSTGHTIMQGKEKIQAQEGLYLKATSGALIPVPNVNPVVVPKSSEATKVSVEKGSTLVCLMSFQVRDRKEARYFVEFRLEGAPNSLAGFK